MDLHIIKGLLLQMGWFTRCQRVTLSNGILHISFTSWKPTNENVLQGTTLTYAATCPVGQVRFNFHLPYSNFHLPLKNCI